MVSSAWKVAIALFGAAVIAGIVVVAVYSSHLKAKADTGALLGQDLTAFPLIPGCPFPTGAVSASATYVFNIGNLLMDPKVRSATFEWTPSAVGNWTYQYRRNDGLNPLEVPQEMQNTLNCLKNVLSITKLTVKPASFFWNSYINVEVGDLRKRSLNLTFKAQNGQLIELDTIHHWNNAGEYHYDSPTHGSLITELKATLNN